MPAPTLQLPDLTGKILDLSEFRGQRTLLLFWNPSCGFCEQMLPELRQWEERPPADAPRLLVISTGTVEANRAQGLQAPVLLDQNFSVGPRFGVGGTPSAVLVDADGKLASQVGIGAAGVWALAGGVPSPSSSNPHYAAAPGS